MQVPQKPNVAEMQGKLAVRVHRVADLLDISRTQAYALIANKTIPSFKIGKSIRVPVEALERLIADTSRG